MTEKRYFERKWEGEYYIFDSYTISEKEFDEKVEYEDYQAFADSMTGDTVVNRLNELNDENQGLRNFKEKSDKFTKEVEKFFKKHNIDTVNFDLIEEEFELYRKENKELKKELDSFNPVVFNDVIKGTVILYSKGDV